MSIFLDTNCLLRYLLADIEDQFETVCQHVENGACTSPEFIAECVYVLGGTVYGFDRTDVANTMIALLDDIHPPLRRCEGNCFRWLTRGRLRSQGRRRWSTIRDAL